MFTLGMVGLAIASLVTIAGSFIAIITSNFWIAAFPSTASPPLAIQFVSSALFWVLFVFLEVGMCVKYGWRVVWRALFGPGAPGRISWRRFLPRFWLLFLCGLTDIASNLISLYATPHTPEILQALLQVSNAFFSLGISMIFVPEERAKNHRHPLLIIAFVLLMAGLGVASQGTIQAATRVDGSFSQVAWILVYLLSCTVYGSWSVSQRVYLDRAAADDALGIADETEADELLLERAAPSNACYGEELCVVGSPEESLAECSQECSADPGEVPEIVHKSIMLLGDTTFQLILCIVFLPIDTVPWFGNSASLHDTWQGFTNGVQCVFTDSTNFKYGALYSFGYFITYFGEGYLNHYSPTLDSIVLQLCSPVTAILLMIVPQWNIDQGETVWWCQAIAIVVLTAASLVYQKWELLEHATST